MTDMRPILTETFTGNRRTIPGTTTGWTYELTIVETSVDTFAHRFTITVKEIPGNPANARTKTHECYMDAQGIFLWESNNSVISPETCVETFVARIPMYQHERQNAGYQRDLSATLAAYREEQANKPITGEEIYEATAAFGFNQKVTDCITGRTFRTLRKP